MNPNNDDHNKSVVGNVLSDINNNQQLNNANLPKKLAETHQIKGIVNIVVILIIGAVIAVFVGYKSHKWEYSVFIFLGFLVVAAIAVALSIISYKQLKKSENNPAQYNQFQTGTAVVNKQPLPTATISADETVGSWLGPVTVGGKQGIGFEVLSVEHNAQSVNTLLFTNRQVIAVFAGPQDIPQSIAGGNLKQAASTFVKLSDQGAEAKDIQMASLYAKQWQDIVSSMLASGLQNIQQSHFNYGIAYTDIQTVEVKRTFINPGLHIHLKNGQTLVFNTPRKDLLDGCQQYLQQFVAIQSS